LSIVIKVKGFGMENMNSYQVRLFGIEVKKELEEMIEKRKEPLPDLSKFPDDIHKAQTVYSWNRDMEAIFAMLNRYTEKQRKNISLFTLANVFLVWVDYRIEYEKSTDRYFWRNRHQWIAENMFIDFEEKLRRMFYNFIYDIKKLNLGIRIPSIYNIEFYNTLKQVCHLYDRERSNHV